MTKAPVHSEKSSDKRPKKKSKKDKKEKKDKSKNNTKTLENKKKRRSSKDSKTQQQEQSNEDIKRQKKRKKNRDTITNEDSASTFAVFCNASVETLSDENEPLRRRTRSMSDAEDKHNARLSAEEFRRENQITITGSSECAGAMYIAPAPMTSFTQTPFSQPIRKALDAAGFHAPTATQAQSWPIALSGRDIITVAKTGSGKTIGFLLPAFHLFGKSDTVSDRVSPRILVLAPTRELAVQIEEQCVKFGRPSNIRSLCCFGGAPKSLQIHKLKHGIDVLIATPGRLNDLIEMKVVNLSKIVFMVLDEADRMLDMGFEPQIRSIIAQVPSERQSLMFTATWPKEIQSLALQFLKNPIQLKFGDSHQLNANKDITQKIIMIQESGKTAALQKILEEIHPGGTPENVPKTLIFVSRKHACDQLANTLWDVGYSVDSLHGDKLQFLRTKVMDQFKKSQLRVLVATDVAARGLDVKDIEVVVNYDFPIGQSGIENYVHRIGRTGRAGAKGKAYSLFTQGDSKRASQLIGVLRRAEQLVPDELQNMAGRKGGSQGWRGFSGNTKWGANFNKWSR